MRPKQSCLVGMLVLVWLFLFPLTSEAEELTNHNDLPSSPLAPKGEWRKMHPSSFRATVRSAYRQCLRSARVSESDALTEAHCLTLRAELQKEAAGDDSQCREVLVSDGVTFNYMNGHINGHHGVTELVQKQLGRLDKATLCSLGDGVYSYWFRGDPGRSCNNVGFVILPKPKPATGEWVCRLSSTGQVVSGGDQDLYLPSVNLPSCCCGGEGFAVPSLFYRSDSTIQVGQPKVICDWE